MLCEVEVPACVQPDGHEAADDSFALYSRFVTDTPLPDGLVQLRLIEPLAVPLAAEKPVAGPEYGATVSTLTVALILCTLLAHVAYTATLARYVVPATKPCLTVLPF